MIEAKRLPAIPARFSWPTICLAVSVIVAMVPATVTAGESKLIKFSIEDQFRNEHVDDALRGAIVVLIGSDRTGSRYASTWARAIRDAVPDESLRIVDLADVRGVPFFVKRSVRKKFPQDPASPVLLDWNGVFPVAYDFHKDHTNILLFDRQGRLDHQVAVTELDESELRILTKKLTALMGSRVSAATGPND